MTALLWHQSGAHLSVPSFIQAHQDEHSRRMKVKRQTADLETPELINVYKTRLKKAERGKKTKHLSLWSH